MSLLHTFALLSLLRNDAVSIKITQHTAYINERGGGGGMTIGEGNRSIRTKPVPVLLCSP
jgi:hypothetical protein